MPRVPTSYLFRMLAVLMVAAFSAIGCTDKRTPEEMKGTLIFGFGDNFKTFDPARQIYAQETAIIQQVLEPLVKFNNDLELSACLAVEWETPDNCKTWIFTLRQGVTFHDGTPFDAHAVKFHFDRILDPKTAATRRRNIADVERIEVLDDYHVAFHMAAPNCVLPEKLSGAFASIPSPTALQAPGDKVPGDRFARNPVGTGPFRFVDWTPDIAIRLEKNPDHWDAENYHIERLEFRPVRENTTRLILLEQGVLDMADIAFPQVTVARKSPDFNLQSVPSLSIRYVGFNTKKPPFSDVRVRRAANYAVNKQDLIKYMFFGVGEPARGPIPPVLPAANPNVPDYAYDPEKARALLAEAGYPDGFEASFWTQETGTYWKTTEGSVEYLRDIGIDVNIKILDNAVYWDKFDEYLLPDGTAFPTKEGVFDIFVGGWVGGETAHGFLEPLFLGGSYSNSAFYDNPTINRMLAEYKTLPDPLERRKLYKEMQQIIVEDAPWIFAFHGQINMGIRHRVKGYVVNPAGNYYFNGVTLDDDEEG